LRERLSDPAWRRYGMALLAGKMIAVALLLLGILAFTTWMRSGTAFAVEATTQAAATQPATQPAAAVDPYASG